MRGNATPRHYHHQRPEAWTKLPGRVARKRGVRISDGFENHEVLRTPRIARAAALGPTAPFCHETTCLKLIGSSLKLIIDLAILPGIRKQKISRHNARFTPNRRLNKNESMPRLIGSHQHCSTHLGLRNACMGHFGSPKFTPGSKK